MASKLLSSAGKHVLDVHKTEDGKSQEIYATNTASDVIVNENRNTLEDFLPTISVSGDSFEYPMDAVQYGEVEVDDVVANALLLS